jgi:hypothetical protein
VSASTLARLGAGRRGPPAVSIGPTGVSPSHDGGHTCWFWQLRARDSASGNPSDVVRHPHVEFAKRRIKDVTRPVWSHPRPDTSRTGSIGSAERTTLQTTFTEYRSPGRSTPDDQIPQNQSVLVVGGGRAWYTVALRPVSTAPTTLYRSLPGGFVAPKWPEPFCESTSERSDRCNCKGFGARSRIRTDDLLFTRQLL